MTKEILYLANYFNLVNSLTFDLLLGKAIKEESMEKTYILLGTTLDIGHLQSADSTPTCTLIDILTLYYLLSFLFSSFISLSSSFLPSFLHSFLSSFLSFLPSLFFSLLPYLTFFLSSFLPFTQVKY